MNLGYNYSPIDDLVITPLIGFGLVSDIFQDPIGFDTFFYANEETKFNLGIGLHYYPFDNIGFIAKAGTFENLGFGVIYRSY